MKALKKLIPAVALMMVTLVLLGTSTYAWFSMNKTVTATGMTVTAKSNSTYLLIGNADSSTATAIQGLVSTENTATSASAKTTSATVYPVAYNNTSNTITPGTAATGTTGTTVAENSWYTANSTSSSSSTTNITNVQNCLSDCYLQGSKSELLP